MLWGGNFPFLLGGMRDGSGIKSTAGLTSAPCRASSFRRSSGWAPQPGYHAGRDRQDRRQLSRRPGFRPAGSAGPRAKFQFSGPLPGHPLRPVQRLFITTPTNWTPFPSTLLDRMEVIRLAGYIADEKSRSPNSTCCPNSFGNMDLSRTKSRSATRH